MKKNRKRWYPEEGIPGKFLRKMKLILFLCWAGMMQVSAMSYAQTGTVSIRVKETALHEIFQLIEAQCGYTFVYNNEQLNGLKPVSIEMTDAKISKVLDECLKGTDLRYELLDQIIVINRRSALPQTALDLQGTVKDKEGNPLPGVSVFIKGTTIGVATDVDGKFKMQLPEMENMVLVFSFTGMKKQEVKYTKQPVLNIVMEEDVAEMEEVVVNGYFTKNKDSFTGNAVVVSKDELAKVSSNNLLSALQVFDPSFRLKDNVDMGSNPNSMPNFRIRGNSGFGAEGLSEANLKNDPNLPTFILDGYEVDVEKIFDLNMDRIESVTILKDASATAIYGSRAANGVVVVTTVAPKPGELRVTYNFNAGVELPDLSDYNLCNAWEKVEVERLSGKYIAESGDPGMQLEKDIAYNDLVNEVRRGVQTDWLAQPLHNVFNHSHSMNVSGGVESIRYSLDLNYGTHNGAMIDSYRDNVGVGLNLDYRNKSWLQVMNSISFNVTKSQDSPYGNFDTYAKLQPYWAPYSNDGELLETLKDGKTTNPLYRAEKLGSFSGRSRLNDLTNNFSINIYFTKNFSFKGQLSMTRTDSETKSFSDPKDPSFKGSPTRERGTLTTSSDKGFTWNTNAMFYFNKGIDKHFINATAGLNVQESHSKTTAIEYRGFQLSNLNSPTYAAEQTRKSAVSSDKSRLLGMLASLNYSYNNVYLLDASFRLDGSSKFGEDKRFAPFWSVGAGVNFHNYSWLKDNWLVSLLRVRGTYGVTGNVNFPAYAAISTYKTSDKWYYDTPSNTLIALGNPKLTWEKTYTLDVGINLGLFHDRLVVEGNYYRKETKNQLEQLSVRTSSGFSTYYTNAGSILNKGFEIKLNTTVFQNDNWTVAVNATLASNKNEITKLGQEAERYNKNIQDFHNGKNQGQGGDYSDLLYIPLTQYYVGASTTAIYAVPSYGIDPSNGKELFRKRNGQSTYVWNAADEVVVGDKSPDAQGSFGINVAWKGFYLNTTFLYQWGAQDYNETIKNKVEEADIDGSNVDRRVLTQRWQNPGDIAPFFDLKNKQKTQPTSRFVQDNNYLAFSSISCGYDFNRDLIRKMRLTSLGLRFNMNDVCRWSNIKQERGTSYPYAKNYSFTLSLGF